MCFPGLLRVWAKWRLARPSHTRAGAAGMAEYLDDPHVRSSRPPDFGEESPGTDAHRVLGPLERRRD